MKLRIRRRPGRRFGPIKIGVAAGLVLALAGVAFGTHFSYEHKASIYRFSGSDTTYELMVAMDGLYNNSIGCRSIHPDKNQQTLDLTCQAESASDPTKANFDHDVFVQHFPLGSSFGISQLTKQGLSGIPPVDVARSSRKPKVGDSTALRFVGYARDALSWVCFKGAANAGCNGMPTDATGRPNLTQAQLRSIYKCEITNWSQVGGADVPIKAYQAQIGSGTGPTWDEFLTFRPADGCATPIFENDANLIPAADREEAIYYYSYGRYNQQDPPGHGTVLAQIDGVAATPETVAAGSFRFSRLVYNVIRHNFATRPPLNANDEVRDYVDVTGFLCKPAASHEINPLTGNNYRTDVAAVIKAKGFEPIPFGQTSTVESFPDSFCRVAKVPSA